MTMSETPPPSLLPEIHPVRVRGASWLSGLKTRGVSLRSWASPGEPVLVLHPDGSQSVWRGGLRVPDGARRKTPKFVAIQLPEELLLRRSLVLPRMSQPHSAEALLLEVRSNSPFPPEELAWGSLVRDLEGGQKHADIVLTSRRHVSGFLQDRWLELAAAAKAPEVWALSGEHLPVVIRGYGESRRLHGAAVVRRWNWALAGLALALATMAAMTPTIQLRQRALEAADAFDAVLRRVSPLVRKRDELAALNDRVRSLDLIAADRVDPAGVMESLTQILPDDTYLYSLDIQKTKITASGFTADASALLQKLSSDPRLRNVKAPTAVTRQAGAAKEAFVIEFTMAPKVLPAGAAIAGLAGVTPVATVAAFGAPASLATAAASAPGLPASVAAAPTPAAVPTLAPAPVRSPAKGAPATGGGTSPFVIGGSR